VSGRTFLVGASGIPVKGPLQLQADGKTYKVKDVAETLFPRAIVAVLTQTWSNASHPVEVDFRWVPILRAGINAASDDEARARMNACAAFKLVYFKDPHDKSVVASVTAGGGSTVDELKRKLEDTEVLYAEAQSQIAALMGGDSSSSTLFPSDQDTDAQLARTQQYFSQPEYLLKDYRYLTPARNVVGDNDSMMINHEHIGTAFSPGLVGDVEARDLRLGKMREIMLRVMYDPLSNLVRPATQKPTPRLRDEEELKRFLVLRKEMAKLHLHVLRLLTPGNKIGDSLRDCVLTQLKAVDNKWLGLTMCLRTTEDMRRKFTDYITDGAPNGGQAKEILAGFQFSTSQEQLVAVQMQAWLNLQQGVEPGAAKPKPKK
jgi:hypothetical protein